MSDKITHSATSKSGRPLFEFTPKELDLFGGTGFEFIELHAPDAVDAKGRKLGKAPVGRWRKASPLDIDEAKQLLTKGVNVGVRLRPKDLVIDVDPRSFAEGDDPVSRLEKDLGIQLDDWPKVRTGADGCHFYMTVPEGTLVRDTVEEYPGIEFKGFGRQMVSPGSCHPVTSQPYHWDPLTMPVTSVTSAPQKLIDLIRRPDVTLTSEAGEYTPEQVELLLSGLDPENFRDHDKWLEIMQAAHHSSSGDAREEFLSWSISDGAYSDHEVIIGRRWDSLHADSAGRRITVKTLFKALHSASRSELIDEVHRSDPQDDFADDFGDLPDYIAQQDASETLLDRVNADRFTVLTGGKYLVGREGTDRRTGVFNVEWYTSDAIKQHMNVKSVETPEGKMVPLGTWWTGHPQRRQYDGVIFDPTPNVSHPDLYNLWRGWAVQPRKGDWSKMKSLIRDVLCRGDQVSYDYVVRWMAHMIQHPARPAEVALVFKGSKGSGKGTFCRSLKELAGKHGRHVTSPEQFTGRFNEHLADTILLFVDEGFWAGDKKAEGQLKGLITEKTMSFEGKGKPIIEGPNQLHVVMASNEDWVVPATHDERRFAVFEADEVAAKSFQHFAALNDDDSPERESMLGAMLYDLLHMQLGEFHPRREVPQTQALIDQKLEGFKKIPLDGWWYECLENGTISTVNGKVINWPEAWEAAPHEKDEILDALHYHSKDAAVISKTKLAKYLGRVGVEMGDKVRNSQNQKVWRIPSLEVARQDFEAKIGGKLDWSD